MTRTRSEYRMSPILVAPAQRSLKARHPVEADRDALAAVLLDGYRNTIDDEGEDLDDAYAAIDQYLTRIERPHSFVVIEQEIVVAFSFVVVVKEVHYIDPVVVAPPCKAARAWPGRRCNCALPRSPLRGLLKWAPPSPMATSHPNGSSPDWASPVAASGDDHEVPGVASVRNARLVLMEDVVRATRARSGERGAHTGSTCDVEDAGRSGT